MPTRGRPPKPAAEKKSAGTHRKDRRTEADAPPPPPAHDKSAPAGLSAALKAEWSHVVSDLEAVGTVSRTDLDRLATAFNCKTNAERIQKALASAFDEGAATNISKLQSAHASAIKTADGIIAAVERAVKIRPKAHDDDPMAKFIGGKK